MDPGGARPWRPPPLDPPMDTEQRKRPDEASDEIPLDTSDPVDISNSNQAPDEISANISDMTRTNLRKTSDAMPQLMLARKRTERFSYIDLVEWV